MKELGRDASPDDIVARIGDIFRGQGLKVGVQEYKYTAAGKEYRGKNVYAVLEAPRGDATESMVLVAGWRNMDDVLNESGVALVLALARYFKSTISGSPVARGSRIDDIRRMVTMVERRDFFDYKRF